MSSLSVDGVSGPDEISSWQGVFSSVDSDAWELSSGVGGVCGPHGWGLESWLPVDSKSH